MKLIPETGFTDRDIRRTFRELTSNATALKSAVAYHTLDPHSISADLAELWRRKSSFHCIDISRPNDLDLICELVQSGLNIHIMLRYKDDEKDGFQGLMHAKIYLFEYPEEKAKILIGSHNFTASAITGINVEGSVLHNCKQTDKLYEDISSFLKEIKNKCEKFDPAKLEYYKKLQAMHNEHTKAIIYLRTDRDLKLENASISIFGSIPEESRGMLTVGKKVIIRVISHDTGWKEKSYETKVVDAGLLEEANAAAGGLTFDSRFHAFRDNELIPEILGESAPDPQRVKDASYFVTVEIIEELPQSTRYKFPEDKSRFWLNDNRFVERSDETEIQLGKARVFKAKEENTVERGFESTEQASVKQTKFVEHMVVLRH